jgi:NAD(P)-dependent dehydrogenase (short-subunit alcohol dehydrogenase family)
LAYVVLCGGLQRGSDMLPKTGSTILVLGGAGTFGAHLTRSLLSTAGVETVFVGSRSGSLPVATPQLLTQRAIMAPLIVDARDTKQLGNAILSKNIDIVVDAAGPWQGSDYSIARAVVNARAHYLDIADDPQFISGFVAALDADAQAQQRVAITGASTTPALTASVAQALTNGWERVDSVDTFLLPGGRNVPGLSLMQAALSYCGKPVSTYDSTRGHKKRLGWRSLTWQRFAVGPRKRFCSDVDCADPVILPTICNDKPVQIRVRLRAGLESPIEQVSILCNGCREIGFVNHYDFKLSMAVLSLLPQSVSRSFLAPTLRHLRSITSISCLDEGALHMNVAGVDGQVNDSDTRISFEFSLFVLVVYQGRYTHSRFSLDTRRGQGYAIPTIPSVVIVRNIVRGIINSKHSGASVCSSLSLQDLTDAITLDNPALSSARLSTTIVGQRDSNNQSPFYGALRDEYDSLPEAVKAFSHYNAPAVWHGEGGVTVGTNPFARFANWVAQFPSKSRVGKFVVVVERLVDGSEVWTRILDNEKPFSSRLESRNGNQLWETFLRVPFFSFELAVTRVPSGIHLAIKRWLLVSVLF